MRRCVASSRRACPSIRRLGDDRRVASSLAVLAASAMAGGDADRALALAEEGLAVARRSGDPRSEAMLLFNVGMALAWRGELDEAERAIEESVREGASEPGTPPASGTGSGHSARSRWRGATTKRARRRFEESLAVGRELGQPWCISHSLSDLALVAHEDARRRHGAAAARGERRDRSGRVASGWDSRPTSRCTDGSRPRKVIPVRAAPALRVRERPPRGGRRRPVRARLARSRAARSPASFGDRRGSVRRGVGGGTRADAGRGARLRTRGGVDDERTTSRRLRVQRA